MSELTQEQKEKYIKSGGVSCPYCGSQDIEGGDKEMNDGQVIQDIYCLDCGLSWQDIYTLTDVVDDNEGNN